MSEIFSYKGNDWSVFSNPKDAGCYCSLIPQVDVYFPHKRSRVSAPLISSGGRFEQKKQASIDVLPDECLFEIFRRLPGGQEKSACACVSKHWLMLLSNIHRDELWSSATSQPDKLVGRVMSIQGNESGNKVEADASQNNKMTAEADDQGSENDGYLSRCLEGRKATDVRLAAISVGSGSRGGLGKLTIRGNDNKHGVTNFGLKAIARGCPSLKVLSLRNVSSVGDAGLLEIAINCHLLENLDLGHCSGITDKVLVSLAKSCSRLTSLTIESCPNIGNDSLKAVGQFCSNLKSISIKDCPLVTDQGIASLFSSASYVLTKVKLQALNITDVSLAIIGYYGMAVTDLVLTSLTNVNERGFWVMGNGHGLQKLMSFTVTSCPGMTDIGLEAVGKGCPNVRQLCLRKCAYLSDYGLVSLAKATVSLESLQLEECHGITQYGFFGAIMSAKLKTLTVVNCFGIKDLNSELSLLPCKSLRSLSIRNCPGFGNANLRSLEVLCTRLQQLDLSGLHGITDSGLLSLLRSCEEGLMKVNLSGCVNLTDGVVSSLVRMHGQTLEMLSLDGCKQITDASLVSIAENCLFIRDVDVSTCAITDYGLAVLACAKQINLQILAISGCSLISDKSLPFLMKMGQTLFGLNIQRCNAISSKAVGMLMEQLWRCDILS